MKKNLQLVKSTFSAFLLAIFVLILSTTNAGTLYFKMAAPKTTLEIGEEVVVTVSAWVNDIAATGINGLDTWQLDLSVSQTGIVEITNTGGTADISLLAPDPDLLLSGWDEESINTPFTGEARSIAVTQDVFGNPTTIGVAVYTDIFTFKIKGLSLGSVTYEICSDNGGGLLGILRDGKEFDNDSYDAYGSVDFDAENSDAVFTVIPEPASLTVFAVAGLISIIRKK
ncbi:MAG: hypothetical protein ABFD79_14920 [Phycisphaerales bacterium]